MFYTSDHVDYRRFAKCSIILFIFVHVEVFAVILFNLRILMLMHPQNIKFCNCRIGYPNYLSKCMTVVILVIVRYFLRCCVVSFTSWWVTMHSWCVFTKDILVKSLIFPNEIIILMAYLLTWHGIFMYWASSLLMHDVFGHPKKNRLSIMTSNPNTNSYSINGKI